MRREIESVAEYGACPKDVYVAKRGVAKRGVAKRCNRGVWLVPVGSL